MPLFELGSTQHIDMLRERGSRLARSLPVRIARAVRRELSTNAVYGYEWGDPDTWDPLRFARDNYVLPFVDPSHVAVEIGPGGGRWTRYLLGFKTLYAVDYYEPLLAEFRKAYGRRANVRPVKNNGADFPGIPPRSVDYVFSFGCFVHLGEPLVRRYVENILAILKPSGRAVIHYSDKTKIMAKLNAGFAPNDPVTMRGIVNEAGGRIVAEDTTTLWHSSIVQFSP